MKENKTDSEIFAAIRQTLESYEEAYVPGAWEAFAQIQKRRKRSRYLRIASVLAACLILGSIGSNYFLFNKPGLPLMNSGQIANIQSVPPKPEKTAERKAAPAVSTKKSGLKTASMFQMASISKPGHSENIQAKHGTEPSKPLDGAAFAHDSTERRVALVANANLQKPKSVSDTLINLPDTAGRETKNKIAESQLTTDYQDVQTVPKRKIRFGFNFSPGVSSTQSASSFCYTGGVSADIPLFANVQLSTGLQLENQTIVNKTLSMSSADASSYNQIAMSSNQKPIPFNQTESRLVNLDLPLNITWKFIAQKTHSYYVSTGFSSLVYLKQENTITRYSNQLVPVSAMVGGQEVKTFDLVSQESVTVDSSTPGQAFDFAGRFNIMLGVERKLSNRIFIHLEPYTKIPITGKEAGSLMNTTSGINFKVSF
jgi:hypothetical protein